MLRIPGHVPATLLMCLALSTAAGAEPEVTAADLPRVSPTEPAAALETFRVRPGFSLELAASEPDVVDPIAMCFDERGRMYVVEMRDYSERREERLGRIRMLEDADNDGRYEKSTVFIADLPWPTAVMYVNGGVLIGACPDILFAKDTSGDGVADETKVLFTGFGNTQERLNVQGLFNNFIWGLDNRIHGCSGLNGGLVEQKLHADNPPLDVRNRGLAIDLRDWSMTTENGGGQYGLSFDPWGRLYTCSNSSHIETFMYDARYAAQNPHYAMPNPRVMIAADGPAAEVYRISPEEPWRVIRTRWRVAGLVKGVVEGGGRSAGYFTGATGITIYRGNAYGPAYVGDAFVGDAGGNLVHHKRIRRGERDPLELVAERPADEKMIEFVASTDNWFRPVDFANAPDGTLYIADMYRETIEHPWSIPPNIKQFLDLNSGNDRGRIYRIVPDGFQRPEPPRLDQATVPQLVATLEHPNGWHRETASRLIFERQDRAAIAPLVELMETSSVDLGRLHALHALDGLGALEEKHVLAAMGDKAPVVRAHAVALAEQFMPNAMPSVALWEKLVSLAEDASVDVRYQLAFTLGRLRHADRVKVLATTVKSYLASRWTRAAAMSSLSEGALEMLAELSDLTPASDSPEFVRELARQVGASGDRESAEKVAVALRRLPDAVRRYSVAASLAEGAAAGKILEPLRPKMADHFAGAAKLAADAKAPAEDRVAAVSFLAFGKDEVRPALLAALDEPKSQQLQLAALAALDRVGGASFARDVIDRWKSFRPRVRSEALNLLLKRPDRALGVLAAVQEETITASELSAPQQNFLRSHPNPRVKQLASMVLASPATQPREAVVESFRPAASLSGDARRGHAIYQKLCISCHKLGEEGFVLGPDLTTVRNAGKEKLLLNIIDPSREVQPNFVSYQIDTTDGESVVGVVVSDTPAGITVRQAYGKETTIRREQIKRMSSDGRSIMPDGLETGLSAQDMADLLTFIETVKP